MLVLFDNQQKKTVEKPKQIVNKVTYNISEEAALYLPEYCSSQKNIHLRTKIGILATTVPSECLYLEQKTI